MPLRSGVKALLDKNMTKHLDLLLFALRDGIFLDEDLEKIAIRTIFEEDSRRHRIEAPLVKRFFDHPAISAKSYYVALHNAYYNGGKNGKLFCWLLKEATHLDFSAALQNKKFRTETPEFQRVVSDYWVVVGPGRSRRKEGRERRIAILDEALGYSIPTEVLKIMLEYNFLL